MLICTSLAPEKTPFTKQISAARQVDVVLIIKTSPTPGGMVIPEIENVRTMSLLKLVRSPKPCPVLKCRKKKKVTRYPSSINEFTAQLPAKLVLQQRSESLRLNHHLGYLQIAHHTCYRPEFSVPRPARERREIKTVLGVQAIAIIFSKTRGKARPSHRRLNWNPATGTVLAK